MATDAAGQAPPAPIPSSVDLQDFQFLPLDVLRLRDSMLAVEASGDEFRAAVLLWCVSWHQVPAASLPNSEQALAAYAGYGRDPKGWKKVRAGALRGFVLCDDGRLYHPVLAEKAAEAWEGKLKRRHLRECERIKKAAQRAGTTPAYPSFDEWKAHLAETGSDRWESPVVSQGTDKGQVDERPEGHGGDVPMESHPLKGQGIGTVDRDSGEGQEKGTEAKHGRTASDLPSAGASSKKGGVLLDTWIASLGDRDAIPADDPIFAYAENAGIPSEFLELSWFVFRARARESKKRQVDWRQTYRNYVKGGYLKLWYIDGDGVHRLTSTGTEWQRVMEAEQERAAA
ncbi:hypothetical protein IM816_05750 [Luteibacter flocculans]|uniref:DUF1376 domain-containing protein n=1 Tax=Luteibacter flocculans TaxID=2780091 RepID=A0ABY4T4H4_9GAMM|nr:YdaU family protein [Luteibacter flocculans]URL59600.1 hypothetical protein IM816_05750 [Luteibacter flocculans]